MHIPTPEELKARREMLGIRQAALAELAGISQSMVARIEAGSVDPRVSTLEKIVRVLNEARKPRMTAAQVMHSPVLFVEPGDPLTTAVEIMDARNISQLPVIENGVPVGCISETAIVSALEDRGAAKGHDLAVHQVLEPGFPTVPPGMDIETVVKILQKHHAVLVMDEGKVRGVITKHDLISLIIER
ncbi:MAG: CBS domain-containing protein [Methanomicrobiales archaeon]|nr:CBS domain-containing protein [Methanomicrobiales archaeon]NYT20760.1 CBS domain-containing protein [Methanomicrobiales archaeon]